MLMIGAMGARWSLFEYTILDFQRFTDQESGQVFSPARFNSPVTAEGAKPVDNLLF
jgi:hypothetical protein